MGISLSIREKEGEDSKELPEETQNRGAQRRALLFRERIFFDPYKAFRCSLILLVALVLDS